jgi:hypothetical protein
MTVTKSRFNEEVPGHQKGFRFKNPAQGKSLSLKLSNIRFTIRFKGNLSPTKL